MNSHITFKQARAMLETMGLDCEILPLADGWKALVTRYGGRLLGPFSGEEAESVLWTAPAMGDAQSFRSFVENRSVHLGGERFWVNPELRFYCKAPELFDETYTVQEAIDPGNYTLEKKGDQVFLHLDCCLTDLNDGAARKRLSVTRRYAPAPSPLLYHPALKELAVEYCGYVQDIDLSDESPETPMYLEPWVLTQVNPPGRFITPFLGQFDFVDYYDPVGDLQQVHENYAELTVTGDRKYKVAYRSLNTFGRMAFLKPWGEGWHLMVRNYYNDPSIPYCAEPWGDLGNRGCSTYYYNDDLSNGGFAEFEHSGATIGPDTGRSRSHSTTSLWFFFGGQGEISKLMKHLLGVDYAF